MHPWAELKQLNWICVVGLIMVLCGDCLRKSAMLTAGSNFNHIVQNEKAHSHVLVTNGVYSFFRHPSYVGWFYWSIGTQVWGGQIKLRTWLLGLNFHWVKLEHSVVITKNVWLLCDCRGGRIISLSSSPLGKWKLQCSAQFVSFSISFPRLKIGLLT